MPPDPIDLHAARASIATGERRGVGTIEASLAADKLFHDTNALLLRGPSVVNQLDGCAIALPCHVRGEMPVGLMAWSTAQGDDTVLDAARAIEAALAPSRS